MHLHTRSYVAGYLVHSEQEQTFFCIQYLKPKKNLFQLYIDKYILRMQEFSFKSNFLLILVFKVS